MLQGALQVSRKFLRGGRFGGRKRGKLSKIHAQEKGEVRGRLESARFAPEAREPFKSHTDTSSSTTLFWTFIMTLGLPPPALTVLVGRFGGSVSPRLSRVETDEERVMPDACAISSSSSTSWRDDACGSGSTVLNPEGPEPVSSPSP
eukprot:Hpha_TRINITY_DN16793_c1_g3::TRINITY_DN16793_c1_g3_i1::g.76336::m.76336